MGTIKLQPNPDLGNAKQYDWSDLEAIDDRTQTLLEALLEQPQGREA